MFFAKEMFKKKKPYLAELFSLLLIFLIVFPCLAATEYQPLIPAVVDLQDIEGHWAESTISSCVQQGIVAGYPNQTFECDCQEKSDPRARKILIHRCQENSDPFEGKRWENTDPPYGLFVF